MGDRRSSHVDCITKGTEDGICGQRAISDRQEGAMLANVIYSAS